MSAGQAYGDALSAESRARLVCGKCGAKDCKLWRESACFAPDVLCGPCALADQGKAGPLDASGKRVSEWGPTDQIGAYVPAVPDRAGVGWWNYASVPGDACEWWRSLPSYPSKAEVAS